MNDRDVVAIEKKNIEWKYKNVASIPNESDRALMESAVRVLEERESQNSRMKVSAGIQGNERTSHALNTESLHAEVNALYDYFASCIADGAEPDVQKIVVCAEEGSPSSPDVCGKCLSTISRFVAHQKTPPDKIKVLVRKRDGTVYEQTLASLHPKPFEPLTVEIDDINKRVLEILGKRGVDTAPLRLPPHVRAGIYKLAVRLKKK